MHDERRREHSRGDRRIHFAELALLDAEKRGTKMIMQVHDELVFEVPESEVEWVRTEIPRLMAGVAELKVPLLAENR